MKKIIHSFLAVLISGFTFLPTLVAAPVHAQLNVGDFTNKALEEVAPNAEDVTEDVENLEDGSVESAVNAALQDPTNIDARKQAILAADQKALDSLVVSESAVQNSQYLSQAQKDQLKSCNDAAEKQIKDHMAAVTAATTQDQLLAAHQGYINDLDPENVQACVMTAVALGIQAFLEASDIFLSYTKQYLEEYLPEVCMQNGGQEIVDLAEQGFTVDVPEGESALNAVFADGTISESEIPAMENLVIQVAEVAEVDLTVYLAVTSGIELCAGGGV